MRTESIRRGYEIRVKGHLDPYWADWFEEWTITNLEDGDALLSNLRVDQAGLHSALNKIRDLNLILLSVLSIPMQPSDSRKERSP
jgi:hypothetical protein